MPTVVHCLADSERRGGHWQKLYSDKHRRKEETAAKHLSGSVLEIFKCWSLEVIIADEDGLSRAKWKKAEREMSRMATCCYKLPSWWKTFISVHERPFQTSVTDTLES